MRADSLRRTIALGLVTAAISLGPIVVVSCGGASGSSPPNEPASVGTVVVPAELQPSEPSPTEQPALVEEEAAPESTGNPRAPAVTTVSPPTTTTAPRPAASDLLLARNRFRQGVQAYAEGRYTDARDAFEDAYNIVPNAAVLYNLARVEMKIGDVQAACAHLAEWKAKANPADHQLNSVASELQQCGISP